MKPMYQCITMVLLFALTMSASRVTAALDGELETSVEGDTILDTSVDVDTEVEAELETSEDGEIKLDPKVKVDPGVDVSNGMIAVVNNADSGPGSFRYAVNLANTTPQISQIKFVKNVGTVVLQSTVTYTGHQDLKILGEGSTLSGNGTGAFDLFVSQGGARLGISGLNVKNSGGNGIFVSVPDGALNDVELSLSELSLQNNALFALTVVDATGAPAGVQLTVDSCEISGNAFGAPNFDGIRVAESGPGDVVAYLNNSFFDGNGCDGIELQERNAGNIDFEARDCTFNGNGYFDPADPHEGIDLDESGDGHLMATITDTRVNDNAHEGMNFDERDFGNLVISLQRVEASNNFREGIRLCERQPGDLFADLNQVMANGSLSQDGIQSEELEDGAYRMTVTDSAFTFNDRWGLRALQFTPGDGELRLNNVTFESNGDGDVDAEGVTVINAAP